MWLFFLLHFHLLEINQPWNTNTFLPQLTLFTLTCFLCGADVQVFDQSALSLEAKEDMYKLYPNARRAHLKTGGNFPYLCRSAEVNLYIQVGCWRISRLVAPVLASSSILLRNIHFYLQWTKPWQNLCSHHVSFQNILLRQPKISGLCNTFKMSQPPFESWEVRLLIDGLNNFDLTVCLQFLWLFLIIDCHCTHQNYEGTHMEYVFKNRVGNNRIVS